MIARRVINLFTITFVFFKEKEKSLSLPSNTE